jgi:flagellar hook protein FlgE
MSLLSSMSSGTTGLASASAELSVVSDNLANSNTIGFKAGRAAFEDALAQSVVGGLGQIGLGSRLEAVQRMLTQGALANTGRNLDLALQGDGFFVVHGTAADGRTGTYYTRAGQMTVDSTGYLTTLDGLRVQGYPADATGTIQATVGDLQIANASSQPQATGTVTVKGNLDSSATVPAAWDPANPSGTSNFNTEAKVYDSLGAEHVLQVYFRNAGPDPANPTQTLWEWNALADGASQNPPQVGQVVVASGTLNFDQQGRLASASPAVSSFNPAGALPQALTFNFGDSLATGGTGRGGMTQNAADSGVSYVGQDGWAYGTLTGWQFDKTGVIEGVFTNGQMRALGQVLVATLPAADQMERIGGNLYAETRSSGQAVVGAPGVGGRSFISSGALEQSNVDIADQFVRMIAAQRAFEANSKTITTADQLLSELIAMKR